MMYTGGDIFHCHHSTRYRSAVAKREKQLRLNSRSFFNICVEENIKTPKELYKYISELEFEDKAIFFSFLSKKTFDDIRRELSCIWDCVHGMVNELPSREDCMNTAFSSQCACSGFVFNNMKAILERNSIDKSEFCNTVLDSLVSGAGKGKNIAVVGKSNTGKTTLLASLASVFGSENVFRRPLTNASFPLINLPNKLVVIMNDFSIESSALNIKDLLVWFEGEDFTINLPKNHSKIDHDYNYHAPIFVTSGEKLAVKKGNYLDVSQTDMLDNRFVYFELFKTIPSPVDSKAKLCARCFMRFLVKHQTLGIFVPKVTPPQLLPQKREPGMSRSLCNTLKKARKNGKHSA